MDAATWGLVIATFVACFVEMVEATTIVMAMGFTRGWRSALVGTAAALGILALVTAVAGYALTTWLPEAALQLVIGTLLLIFGLQWLRKAILRSSGRKAVHDENAIYRDEVEAAQAAKVAMTTPQISGLTSVLLHTLTFSVVTTLTHVGEESRPAALQR